jgi:hypothetical protein
LAVKQDVVKTMIDMIPVIAQVGFPACVAVYTLVVLNKTVARNTEVIIKMNGLIDELIRRNK